MVEAFCNADIHIFTENDVKRPHEAVTSFGALIPLAPTIRGWNVMVTMRLIISEGLPPTEQKSVLCRPMRSGGRALKKGTTQK